MKKFSLGLLVLAMAGLSGVACAQQAGNHIVGFSAAGILPQDSSDPLVSSVNGGPSVVDANSGSGVNDRYTLGLIYDYMVTDNWSVGAVLGIPPKFTLSGEGGLASQGKLGDANMYSPSAVVKYHFGAPNDKFRPFVGAGVSYVWFNSINLTNGLSNHAASGISRATGLPAAYVKGAGSTASLSKEWAPLITVGASYKLTDKWALSGSLSYEKLKTDADVVSYVNVTNPFTGVTTCSTVHSRTSLTLDPIVVKIGLNYTF